VEEVPVVESEAIGDVKSGLTTALTDRGSALRSKVVGHGVISISSA
jgi:hypothetical protein